MLRPEPVIRRLLLLWEEDPGPSEIRQLRYFLGLDGYGGKACVVVGSATTLTDLQVVKVSQWTFRSHAELLRALRDLNREYRFEAGYLDLIEPYKELIKCMPRLEVVSRITKSRRNDIHEKVGRYMSHDTLNAAYLSALSASGNDVSHSDQSYYDALGMMVWCFEVAQLSTENARS